MPISRQSKTGQKLKFIFFFQGWQELQRPVYDLQPGPVVLNDFEASHDSRQPRQGRHLEGVVEADGGHRRHRRASRDSSRGPGHGVRPRREADDQLFRRRQIRRCRRFRRRRLQVSFLSCLQKKLLFKLVKHLPHIDKTIDALDI